MQINEKPVFSYKLPKGNELTWKVKDKLISVSKLNTYQLEIANKVVNNTNSTHIGKIPKQVYVDILEQRLNLVQLTKRVNTFNIKQRVYNSIIKHPINQLLIKYNL